MKKVLSMVLVLALVLTTLVVPMTVSAADGEVAISYEISAVDKDDETRQDGKIYVGDTVTVTVKATGNKIMEGYEVYIPYTGITVNETITFTYAEATYVKFIKETDATVTNEGYTIGTFTFTAPAAGSYQINAVSDSLSYFGDGFAESKFASTEKPYTVLAHTGAVAITGEGVNVSLDDETTSGSAATEEAVELDVEISSPTNSKIENAVLKNRGEVIDNAFTDNAATITEYGEYTISFDTQDGAPHTYSFIYKTSTQIDILASIDNANGFTPGATVSLAIAVDGLSDSVVEELTFGIKYDTDAFTIGEEPTDVTIASGTDEATNDITWAASSTGVSGEGEQPVFTLTFTVNADYKVAGTKSFELIKEKAAVNGFDAAEAAVQATEDVAYATIHNGAATFEVTDPSTAWDQEKTANVAYAEGWSGDAVVKYAVYESAQDPAVAKTIFDNLEATTVELANENNITVNEAKYYYIVAQFGTEGNYVYQIVDTWTADAVYIDKTAPTATVDAITEWANKTGRPTITINVADTDSGVVDVKYNFTSADAAEEDWQTVEDYIDFAETATVVLPDEDIVYAMIYVKAIDGVGIESAAAGFDIKYDNKKPVITDPVAGIFDGTGVTITSTLQDEGNASDAPEAVEVWEDEVKVGDATLTGTAISYKVTSNGTYTFKATDGAGNTGENSIIVTNAVSESTLVAPIFQVVQGEDAPTGYFKGAQDLTELGLTTNGTFTYVKITPGVAPEEKADKLTTTYMLQKDQDGAQDVSTGIELNATDNAGTYTLTATTIYGDNPNDNKTETYKFTIAGAYEDNFLTVNGDNKYRVTDWRILDLLADAEATDANFKETITVDERQLWQGGYFAGDVDGSLEAADWFDDATTLLTELKTARVWAQYQFALFNNLPVVEEEPAE